ncbi:ZIP zinc transporter-domain-containing protein [Biscogniauxia mediterranea]|nr:ZIP zinc transporter-domain-containing protein [Biscogniauxia mediterranea]
MGDGDEKPYSIPATVDPRSYRHSMSVANMDVRKEGCANSLCSRETDGLPEKVMSCWNKETKRNNTHLGPGAIGSLNHQNPSRFATESLRPRQPQGWASWSASVIICSMLFTMLREVDLGAYLRRGNSMNTASFNGNIEEIAATGVNPSLYKTTMPTLRRRTSCESGGSRHADHNLSLRVGAVFIILFVSTLACAFPILAAKFPGLRMPSNFFFAIRHFGTGVLIATAFVHLLPTAFTLLGDPCLSSFWTDDYPAMPGAIALAGIFFVTVIEMLLHPARSTPSRVDTADSPERPISEKRPLKGRQGSIGRSLSGIVSDGRPKDETTQCEASNDNGTAPTKQSAEVREQGNTPAILTPEQKHKKEIMHCLLLEMGILFHSVFIGMALSVSIGGSEFIGLLIAITFHQTFEGLALGARIAAIEWPKKSSRPIFMALAYGCTTPIGQAIGLAARSAYSPESEVGLILVGVMNALSSGLLVFASLVELLSEDLLSDESWRVLRGRRRVCAFILVVAGAFAMSLVGAWA